MKKIITIAAAIAAMFTVISCEKEIVSAETTDAKTVICANIEDELTKTELNGNDAEGYDVVWSEGDVITVGGEEFTLIKGEGTTKGTFEGPQLADGTYDAFYVATSATIPTTQTYKPGKITNAPMQAQVTVEDGAAGTINFTNMGGLLRLTVKNDQQTSAKSIKVFGNLSTSSSMFYLDCSEDGVAIEEDGTEFLIAMPQGSYSNVSITITDTKNKEVTKTLGNGKTLGINRSQITNASFSVKFEGDYKTYHNGHEYVDLGLPSGLKWATCNVGASDMTQTGNFYAWGEVETKTTYNLQTYSSPAFFSVPKEYDAASLSWGGSWRMPTEEEVRELMENGEWILRNAGYRVKGTADGYTNASILFPFTGSMEDSVLSNTSNGYFWTASSSDKNGLPYVLMLKCDSQTLKYSYDCTYAYPYHGFTIRPVCDK